MKLVLATLLTFSASASAFIGFYGDVYGDAWRGIIDNTRACDRGQQHVQSDLTFREMLAAVSQAYAQNRLGQANVQVVVDEGYTTTIHDNSTGRRCTATFNPKTCYRATCN